jgi:hypothetical protein
MKRIFISLGLGILLSILYLILLALAFGAIKRWTGSNDAESWWYVALTFPFEWGGQVFNFFFPAQFEKPYALLRGPAVISDIVGSVLFFSAFPYAFMTWRSRRTLLP